MNIHILRHGIAVAHGAPGYARDADRPLTRAGRRELRQIATAMKKLELSYSLILSSPYARTRQTAEMVADKLRLRDKLKFSEHLIPNGSLEKLIQSLQRSGPRLKNILLVGHEPYLSGMISLLVSGKPHFDVRMKKGGLCKLSIERLEHGRCATLAWLLTPKQMALMS